MKWSCCYNFIVRRKIFYAAPATEDTVTLSTHSKRDSVLCAVVSANLAGIIG